MLPAYLLSQISPPAAKLYMVLFTLMEPDSPDPVIRAPITVLASTAALSPRSCWIALRELQNLRLIHRLPRQYQKANTYLLLPVPPVPPAAEPSSTTAQLGGHEPSSTAQSIAHDTAPIAQRHAHYPSSTRISALKNPTAQPPAWLLNTNTTSHTSMAPPDSNTDYSSLFPDPSTDPEAYDACIRVLYDQLSPEQKVQLLAEAQATLARLDALETQEVAL